MFLSHPYKFLFLIRHKDKKDLARVQFKNSGRSGVQTAESVIPPFFFLSPPKKRGQTKKARISPRSSPNGSNCRRRLLTIPSFAGIIVQGRKRIKRLGPCFCVFFKLFPHICQRPAGWSLRAFSSVFIERRPSRSGGGPLALRLRLAFAGALCSNPSAGFWGRK